MNFDDNGKKEDVNHTHAHTQIHWSFSTKHRENMKIPIDMAVNFQDVFSFS